MTTQIELSPTDRKLAGKYLKEIGKKAGQLDQVVCRKDGFVVKDLEKHNARHHRPGRKAVRKAA